MLMGCNYECDVVEVFRTVMFRPQPSSQKGCFDVVLNNEERAPTSFLNYPRISETS